MPQKCKIDKAIDIWGPIESTVTKKIFDIWGRLERKNVIKLYNSTIKELTIHDIETPSEKKLKAAEH